MANEMILIMVYGSWGSEPYSTAYSVEEAKRAAQTASVNDPANEYVVELEPGGWHNPRYVSGVEQ